MQIYKDASILITLACKLTYSDFKLEPKRYQFCQKDIHIVQSTSLITFFFLFWQGSQLLKSLLPTSAWKYMQTAQRDPNITEGTFSS